MKQTAKNKNLFRIVAVSLLAAFWVMIPFILNDKTVSADELSDTRIQATLSGAAVNGVTPAGFSEWRLDDSGRRRLDVQASAVNLPAGTVLSIVINNAQVGQMSVNSFGGAFFSIDTNNNQPVPVVNFGNPIQVNNGAATVLAGTFGTVTATPSPSGSPNASPSPSVSPTGSPNASPSPSPTASPNASPSPSPSVSPTGSPNPSPTASPTPTGSPNPSPSPNAGDLFAGLSGGTVNGVLPSGFAQYELHSSRTEIEVQVYQVNLPIGTALTVSINNAAVGQIVLESGGQGRLRLRSDRGQNVPVVIAGTTITVQNAGATILSGTFAGATASPSPSPSASPTGSPNPSPSPSPSASPSQGRYFEVHPTGSRLSPPVTTAANGEFKVFLSADETQATLTGEFHNLSSAQTGAKIVTTIGAGTVIHDFGAIGGANGNFANATISVSAIQVQQLRAGLWFVTLTSANNPGGEIGGTFIQHSNSGDFDGDGSNDFAVFRPSSGTWYSENSTGFRALNFGGASDIPISADYDGDGKTDAAVFKDVNGSGIWEINRSSDGGVSVTQFGFASDTPVRGDFDGDGRNDLAVYRPSTGVWYVQKSDNTGFQIVQWGLAEDIPLSSDMDGDGKADITVFRPSTGVWYWINSASGSIGIVRFGLSGDKPVKGDFDGDGRDDVAVYRPSTGVWYIWKSGDGGYDIRQFGIAEDIPVAGNYDGDNKTDIAVFRPSTGDWYIWRSVDQTYEFRHFGLTGDIPTVR
jgi:hypothetical protein